MASHPQVGRVTGSPSFAARPLQTAPCLTGSVFLFCEGQREERSQGDLHLVLSPPHVLGDKALPLPVPRFTQREGRMSWDYAAGTQCASPSRAVTQRPRLGLLTEEPPSASVSLTRNGTLEQVFFVFTCHSGRILLSSPR